MIISDGNNLNITCYVCSLWYFEAVNESWLGASRRENFWRLYLVPWMENAFISQSVWMRVPMATHPEMKGCNRRVKTSGLTSGLAQKINKWLWPYICAYLFDDLCAQLGTFVASLLLLPELQIPEFCTVDLYDHEPPFTTHPMSFSPSDSLKLVKLASVPVSLILLSKSLQSQRSLTLLLLLALKWCLQIRELLIMSFSLMIPQLIRQPVHLAVSGGTRHPDDWSV